MFFSHSFETEAGPSRSVNFLVNFLVNFSVNFSVNL